MLGVDSETMSSSVCEKGRLNMLRRLSLALLAVSCLGMDCEGNGPVGASIPKSTLNVMVQGQADVVLDPPGGIYDVGTVVQLTANPSPGWVFSHWEGDAESTDPVISISMDDERSVSAVFVELVYLDGFVSGGGTIQVDPVGLPELTGFLYPSGSEVTLTAIAEPGWDFFGWYGDIESDDPILMITLSEDTFVAAFFVNLAPPPLPVTNAVVVAADGQFLGAIDSSRFNLDSLANPFGQYGSTFNALSIWNSFGTYGNPFSTLSPYSTATSTPPQVIINGAFDSFLTKNTFLSPRIDPDDLAVAIGRPEVVRN